MSGLDALIKLTDIQGSHVDRRLQLRSFAKENGWHPSDEILDYRNTAEFSTGHLVVEHGLNNTAVITFLRHSRPFTALSYSDQHTILSLSYNNLVDWHFFPDRFGVLRVFNRTAPLHTRYVSIADDPSVLRRIVRPFGW